MKSLKKIVAFSLLVLFVAVQACNKDKGPDPSQHEYYQPVELGKWYRYAIDSSFYKHNDTAGSIQYSLIESYDTDVPNQSGKLETRIKIEKLDANPSRVIGFSYIQRYFDNATNAYSIERVDNGVRYVLFKTPLVNGTKTDRNAKNNISDIDEWVVGHYGGAGGGAGGNYDHIFRLVKKEYSDSVTLISDYELYAFNVGLFYKERRYISGRTDTANWKNIPVEQRPDTMVFYKKSLVDRGDIQ